MLLDEPSSLHLLSSSNDRLCNQSHEDIYQPRSTAVSIQKNSTFYNITIMLGLQKEHCVAGAYVLVPTATFLLADTLAVRWELTHKER